MKKTIIFSILVLLAAVALFVYLEYNRTNEDLVNRKADFSVSGEALLAAFEKDTASASRTYTDKVIEVSGNVKSIDKEGNPVVISMGTPGEMSSVQCSMDSAHRSSYLNVHEGDQLIVKGMCNGGKSEEFFGTDVFLNRCVIIQKK